MEKKNSLTMEPLHTRDRKSSVIENSVEQKVNKQKKSILSSKGSSDYKRSRSSSRNTIQWEERIKKKEERSLEEKIQAHKKSKLHALGLLISRGAKWSYIQDFISLLKTEEGFSSVVAKLTEEEYPDAKATVFENTWFGMISKPHDQCVDLTLDQHVKLELLKHKIKTKNNSYLKKHPELGILLSKVYRQLFFVKPDQPITFIANYVHHLNTHREELILDDINVPFDQPPDPEQVEQEKLAEERENTKRLAREIVEECITVASKGETFFNVTSIIDSLLRRVSPSTSSVEGFRSSTEEFVVDILKCIMTDAVISGTKSSELISEQVLDIVFENMFSPTSLRSESLDYEDLKQNVEDFVRGLLKNVETAAMKELKSREKLLRLDKKIGGNLRSFSSFNQSGAELSHKPILKKELSMKDISALSLDDDDSDNVTDNITSDKLASSKVKFKSLL